MIKTLVSFFLFFSICSIGFAQNIVVSAWEDDNGDGLRNIPQESNCGIFEVNVQLINAITALPALDANGNAYPIGFTDGPDFSYVFTTVPTGVYYIQFYYDLIWYPTIPDVTGGNDEFTDVGNDSDLISLNNGIGQSHTFTINSSTTIINIDVGLYHTSDIGNYIFNDVLGDGCSNGDPGMSGIEVRIEKEEPIGSSLYSLARDVFGNVMSPQLSDASGNYLFSNIPPGNYRIVTTDPLAHRYLTVEDFYGGNTHDTDGSTDSDAVDQGDGITGITHTIELRSKENLDQLDIDIGYYCLQSVGNLIWYDDNNNGIFDSNGELGASSIVMELWNSGVLLQSIHSNIGNYAFTDIPPGENYQIVISQSNWLIGASLVGYASSTPVYPIRPSVDNQNNGTGPVGGPIVSELFDVRSCMEPIDDEDFDNRTNTTIDFGLYVPPCDPMLTQSIPEHKMYQQCSDGTENDAESNPICDLQILDNYCAAMPGTITNSGFDPVCTGGNSGGSSYNTHWVSFIAGSPHIILAITPDNCSLSNGTAGINAGIYDGCPLDPDASAIWCQGIPCVDGPQILDNLDSSTGAGSGQFYVPGQQYYLFINGCNGTVCNIEIDIIAGAQPYNIPELEIECNDCSQINTNGAYQLCIGSNPVSIQAKFTDPDLLDLDINYIWEVQPPFGPYVDTDGDGWGEHINNDTNQQGTIQSWVWDSPGIYLLRTIATNGCDQESDTITINVSNQTVENFDDLYICENQLSNGELDSIDINLAVDAIYSTASNPWSEDPNGDGIIGWQGQSFPSSSFYDSTGFIINSPIAFQSSYFNASGCLVDQKISIYVVDTIVSALVENAFCSTDVLYFDGDTIAQAGIHYVASSLTSSVGCDSITALHVKQIALPGTILTEDCTNQGQLLFFEFDYSQIDFPLSNINANDQEVAIAPENYLSDYLDSLSYRWFDASGNTLNSVSSEQLVMTDGSYSLSVVAWANGLSCTFVFGPVTLDLAPEAPTMLGDWELSVCEGDTVAYHVLSTSDALSYDWTIPGDAKLLLGQGTDTIYVDWSNSLGGELCVASVNDCGISDQVCEQIELTPTPRSRLVANSGICQGAVVDVSFGEMIDPEMDFEWDFDGARIISGGDQSSYGPFTLIWDEPGTYTITLSVSINGCYATDVSQDIEILSSPFADFQYMIDDSLLVVNNTSSHADSFLWHFGDGTVSGEENPIHEYDQDSVYLLSLIAYGPCGTDTIVQTIDIDFQTSILIKEPLESLNNMVIYPNPVVDRFYLKTDQKIEANLYLDLFDLKGRPLIDNQIFDLTSDNLLDLSELSSGIYLLKLSYKNRVQFRKIYLMK